MNKRSYTYRELLEALLELSEEELDLSATVEVEDEFYPIIATDRYRSDDVLDLNHPLLVIGDQNDESAS